MITKYHQASHILTGSSKTLEPGWWYPQYHGIEQQDFSGNHVASYPWVHESPKEAYEVLVTANLLPDYVSNRYHRCSYCAPDSGIHTKLCSKHSYPSAPEPVAIVDCLAWSAVSSIPRAEAMAEELLHSMGTTLRSITWIAANPETTQRKRLNGAYVIKPRDGYTDMGSLGGIDPKFAPLQVPPTTTRIYQQILNEGLILSESYLGHVTILYPSLRYP